MSFSTSRSPSDMPSIVARSQGSGGISGLLPSRVRLRLGRHAAVEVRFEREHRRAVGDELRGRDGRRAAREPRGAYPYTAERWSRSGRSTTMSDRFVPEEPGTRPTPFALAYREYWRWTF